MLYLVPLQQRGCRPRTTRTMHTASFEYPGLYAMLQHIAPDLKTEQPGDLQCHMCIRAHGCSRTHMPRCTVCTACTARAAPSYTSNKIHAQN
mmetsp:Transcript_63140/g.105116  ORF Transcript_63140/g.105116 Transcript_63140/m.105116 type:complete len:92 (-) Transcript_63140:372-647(-)